MANATGDIYYDPYDFDIDADPYPVFRRLRDEAASLLQRPLDFYAVSRFADVESCSVDWQTFSSARGTVLEIIRSDMDMPKGMFIFEDPPLHNLHRRLMARVFTARRVSVLETSMRAYCAAALDPFVGSGGFDFVRDLGADLPMQVISDMLGIPDEDRVAVREQLRRGPAHRGRSTAPTAAVVTRTSDTSAASRPTSPSAAQHPSDDLMTDLIDATFVDDDRRRTPSRRRGDPQLRHAAGRRRQRDDDQAHRVDGLPPRSHPDQRRRAGRGPAV